MVLPRADGRGSKRASPFEIGEEEWACVAKPLQSSTTSPGSGEELRLEEITKSPMPLFHGLLAAARARRRPCVTRWRAGRAVDQSYVAPQIQLKTELPPPPAAPVSTPPRTAARQNACKSRARMRNEEGGARLQSGRKSPGWFRSIFFGKKGAGYNPSNG
jgi:hypothetical protein